VRGLPQAPIGGGGGWALPPVVVAAAEEAEEAEEEDEEEEGTGEPPAQSLAKFSHASGATSGKSSTTTF